MRSFLSQITNYGLFFIIVFTINSCAHFRIKNLEKNKLSSNNFYEFLSKEYLDFLNMNYMKCTMKLMLIILLIKHLCHLMKKFFS